MIEKIIKCPYCGGYIAINILSGITFCNCDNCDARLSVVVDIKNYSNAEVLYISCEQERSVNGRS